MGLISGAKGEIIKVALKRFTDGDSGSTILGVIAAAILTSGMSFGDLFSKDGAKQAQAIGLLAGSIAVAGYGYFIGKKKPAAQSAPSVDAVDPAK
jgi:hypothetical protein